MARVVVNLVGILTNSGGQTSAAVMSEGARVCARAKAEGEAAVRELVPEAVIFRLDRL